MEIFAVDGFPETKMALALFKGVKNASHLKSTYLNRVALIDAGLVLSVFQLRVAAAMTLEKQTAGKMKTRSLPSELVWSLSGSKNIAGSLQTFSVQEVDNADLLVAAIDVQEDDLRSILGDVQGEPRPLGELGWGLKGVAQQGSKGSEREKWKKMYKITDEELAISSLEDCVVVRMAVKDH